MDEQGLTIPSELGRITIAPEAIAQLVGRVAAECYGVVGMSLRAPLPARERVTRLLPKGKRRAGSSSVTPAARSRSSCTWWSRTGSTSPRWPRPCARRSRYEVERLTGLRVASVDVHIQNVKRTA